MFKVEYLATDMILHYSMRLDSSKHLQLLKLGCELNIGILSLLHLLLESREAWDFCKVVKVAVWF